MTDEELFNLIYLARIPDEQKEKYFEAMRDNKVDKEMINEISEVFETERQFYENINKEAIKLKEHFQKERKEEVKRLKPQFKKLVEKHEEGMKEVLGDMVESGNEIMRHIEKVIADALKTGDREKIEEIRKKLGLK